MKIFLQVSLYLILRFAGHVQGQVCKVSSTGPNNPQCDEDGYEEMYRDSLGSVTRALCCDPKHKDFYKYKATYQGCQVTKCVPPTTANVCGTLNKRTIEGKEVDYEEIMRDTCARRGGQGVTGYCCGRNSSEGLLATTYGAENNEFPHMAKLILPGNCGGTVYNKRFIITASHCIVNKEIGTVNPVTKMKVILGTNIAEQDSEEYVYKVKRAIPHEKYSKLISNPENELNEEAPRTFNDIALLELDRDIKFGPTVKSLEIASADFDPFEYADHAVIVGWGTTDTQALSIHLQKANFILRSDKPCFQKNMQEGKYGVWFQMHDKPDQLLCVGGIMEGKWSPTAGGGDSGGPAICRGSDGKILLCGVTSFGGDDKKCGDNQDENNCQPSVYAEVAYFHDWIKKHAGEQDSSTFYQPYLYGEPVAKGTAEHQVHITSDDGKSCGGTLIDPEFVVTAAQCVMKNDGSGTGLRGINVTTGINDLNAKGQIYKVKAAAVLQGFKRSGKPVDVKKQREAGRIMITDNYNKNDLAIIKLDRKVKIHPRKFPQLPADYDAPEFGVEYAFPNNSDHSGQMRKRDFRLLDPSDCQTRMNRMTRAGVDVTVDDNILCGVEKYSGGSLCDRELGGGLICKGNKGKDTLCGVQIFRLCELSIPNGFMNVAWYSDWIKAAMKQLRSYAVE